MILCRMSQDIRGSYPQTFCRNLSRADYCNFYYVDISFHMLHVLQDENVHVIQRGLEAARSQGAGLKYGVFSS